MDRVAELSRTIQELLEARDEREWTCDEEMHYNYVSAQLSSQLESMERQAVVTATRASQAVKKTPKKVQLYHLRLSLVEKYTSLEVFHKLMQKMAKAEYVNRKPHLFVYVLEQSGDSPSTRGHNVHAHIRFKSHYNHGTLLGKIKRATGLDHSAVGLWTHDNINALRAYMLGGKSDPSKQAKCAQDKCWRIEQGLKMEYIVNV